MHVVDLFAEAEAGRIANDALASTLAVAPSEPQTVYFAFVDRICTIAAAACFNPVPGFFRSYDGGYTWKKCPEDRLRTFPLCGLWCILEDSQHLYVAAPGGLYESRNGGDSWQLNTTLTDAASAGSGLGSWKPDCAVWKR